MSDDDIDLEQEDEEEIDDFIIWLARAYADRNTDGTYVLNPVKLGQMNEAVKLAQELCVDWGSVQVTPLDAKELHGYFSLTMPILHLHAESMIIFRQLTDMVDVMAFYPGSEPEILVEFVINDVYIKAEE